MSAGAELPAKTGGPVRVAVVLFPGSNCDHDALHAAEQVLEADARLVRHDSRDLGDPDLVLLPGGFAYGDYLRAGAMARFAPVMDPVREFAESGGPVLGICNGFQVLCEAGLLPGALVRNADLRFICRDVFIRVETARTRFTHELAEGQLLKVPIAHGEGNYVISAQGLEELRQHDQVVFRYVDGEGRRGHGGNPNGSTDDIAGVCNVVGNVMGMMPHPERCAESILGNTDGALLLRSTVQTLLSTFA